MANHLHRTVLSETNTTPNAATASKRLRNNKYLLRVRILYFAARSIAAHIHVFAGIIRAIYVSRFSGDRFGHRKLALIRCRAWADRCPWHSGSVRYLLSRQVGRRRRHLATGNIDVRRGLPRCTVKLPTDNRHWRGRDMIRSARHSTAH